MNPEAFSEERIASLLAALPPAPPGWTEAAQELPLFAATIDELVWRAVRDDAFRREVLADLEAALASVGVDPGPAAVAALRTRLAAADVS